MTGIRHLELFMEMLAAERNASPNTRAAYRRDLEDVAKHVRTASGDLADAGAEELRNYLSGVARRELRPTTSARRLSAMRQFFRFLVSEGHRADDPSAGLESPKLGRPLPKVLSEDEMSALIAAGREGGGPEHIRLTALLELLYATGLRVSELVELPLSVVNRDQPYLIVRGKGSKERLVPLNGAARQALADYLAVRGTFLPKSVKASPWLFPSHGKSGHLTRQRFGQILKDVAIRAGIAPDRISPHVVRHAFATHLLDHGADLRSLQKMLGHADIATTQIYTHVATGKLSDLVSRHHPLAQGGAAAGVKLRSRKD